MGVGPIMVVRFGLRWHAETTTRREVDNDELLGGVRREHCEASSRDLDSQASLRPKLRSKVDLNWLLS